MLDALVGWENFYVIVGSSAAALTGLQFVVIALIHDTQSTGGASEIDAFGTPQVVHFSAVLLLSAIISAPWRAITAPSVVIAAAGLSGSGYTIVTILRARRTTLYTPVFEDWLWHGILPLASYVAILVGAAGLRGGYPNALFTVGAAALLLLFIGIHNAWDTVTYIALTAARRRREAKADGTVPVTPPDTD
jgi:hypothetical protein